MLRSCKYCGRIHDSKYICKDKAAVQKRKKDTTEQIKFRNRNVWKKKRDEIRERDHHMCQVCLHNILKDNQQSGSPEYDEAECGSSPEHNKIKWGSRRINGENLSVHHIIPLEEDTEREYALENDWLITLCEHHHKMSDSGLIERNVLHELAVNNPAR